MSRFQIGTALRTLTRHFTEERSKVGLLGLYPKYELYTRPLSHYMTLMGLMYVHSALEKTIGSADECE